MYQIVWKCLVDPKRNVNATESNGIQDNGLSNYSAYQNI